MNFTDIPVWVIYKDRFGFIAVQLILRDSKLWIRKDINNEEAVEYYGQHIYFSEEAAWKIIKKS